MSCCHDHEAYEAGLVTHIAECGVCGRWRDLHDFTGIIGRVEACTFCHYHYNEDGPDDHLVVPVLEPVEQPEWPF